MSCNVFANGDAIACKAGADKVVSAFPDVCLSPPSPPAGPIPVPYPNTSFSKDMQSGSKTVMIKNKEVMLKDQSFYKTSPLGDEAATKSLGASVVTHVITGKTYFVAWSMDVKFEDQNVDRHTDLTTSNHASPMGSTPPKDADELASEAAAAGPKCDCCKMPAHSPEQIAGPAMTEEEWYNPDAKARKAKPPNKREAEAMAWATVLRKEARDKKCPVVHDDPKDPCAKHYAIKDPKNRKGIDKEYEESLRPLPREMQKGPFVYLSRYGKTAWHKIKKRMAAIERKMKANKTGIAHKTPRGAGGCPFGTGNVKAVPPGDCDWLEGELGKVQGPISEYHRK